MATEPQKQTPVRNRNFLQEKIELPKWPRLVLKGTQVTREQAQEIIIRTCNPRFHCNDREFLEKINTRLGVDTGSDYFEHIQLQTFRQEYKVLDLDYLCNHRICSCYIGGCHGWCGWGGSIGCNNYNIGKWPNVEEIHRELLLIAKAFPYLSFECQLLDIPEPEKDGEEPECRICGDLTFQVKGGGVTVWNKVPRLTVFIPSPQIAFGWNHTCSYSDFDKALIQTKLSLVQ